MPELPEVETVVRGLRRRRLKGRGITGGRVQWPRTVGGDASVFLEQITGKRISSIRRRAKYIVVDLDSGGYLLIHLRMTGRLQVVGRETERSPYERMALSVDDGRELRFIDTRKFGRFLYRDEVSSILDQLGPEPLAPDFTPSVLRRCVSGHNRQIKPLLLDQHILAGLGNIYVDEALWIAKLHPCRQSGALRRPDYVHLHAGIVEALRRGIANMGTSLGRGQTNFYSVSGRRGRNTELNVFRRDGEGCPRCGTIIERIIVGQRSSHFCPRCQRRPKGLA